VHDEGTSKSMEAEALVQMLQRAPEKNNVSICTIVSDDDSNGRAEAKHVRNGGKLTDTVEEPSFLANPSQCKRVFARAIYTLASAPMKTSRVTKGLAGHLKYCYSACVMRNRNLSTKELSSKVYNILEHICDNHDSCDVVWCYNVKAKEGNKAYAAPREQRINREKDEQTYLQLRKIFDQYACMEQMAYCNHPFDTQTKESVIQAIANVAPKSICYSGTNSLHSCIAMVIGIHNLRHHEFFKTLFESLSMTMLLPKHIASYLQSRDNTKEWKRIIKKNRRKGE